MKHPLLLYFSACALLIGGAFEVYFYTGMHLPPGLFYVFYNRALLSPEVSTGSYFLCDRTINVFSRLSNAKYTIYSDAGYIEH